VVRVFQNLAIFSQKDREYATFEIFDFSTLCKISHKKGCMGLGVQLECTHMCLSFVINVLRALGMTFKQALPALSSMLSGPSYILLALPTKARILCLDSLSSIVA